MNEHYLICVQGVSSQTLASISTAIASSAFAHWNFLNGVWIVCARPGTFSEWALWVNAVVQREEGRCLLLNLPAGTDSHGLLPPNAWPWLKNHLREKH